METKDKTNARTLITLTFSLLAFSIVSFSTFFAAFAAAQDVSIPTLTPYVTDFAGVIEPQYKNAINDYASKLEASTTSEVAVLTVRSTQPMSIEEYAVRVFEKNGIGQKGKDNGILIVVAIDDRVWKLEIGYGLEGTINDAKAGRIGRAYMTDYFREGRYGEGLYLTVSTLGEIIKGDEELSAQFDDNLEDVWIFIALIPLIIILVIVLSFVAFYIKKMRCPKCGGWMKVEYEKDKVCYVCKKCGYKKCEKRRRHAPFFVFVGGWGGGHSGGSDGGGGGGFGGGGSGGGGAGGGW